MPQTQGNNPHANNGYTPQAINKILADTLLDGGSIHSVGNQKAPPGAVVYVHNPSGNDQGLHIPGKNFKGAGGKDN